MKEEQSKPEVIIYTDGACEGNPGRGGYGVVMLWGEKRKELSGGFQCTTNNRMELLAVIEALAALKQPCAVKLYSDSNYVVSAMNEGWVQNWRRKRLAQFAKQTNAKRGFMETLACAVRTTRC